MPLISEDKIIKTVDGVDTTIQATVLKLTNNNPQAVIGVDPNGNILNPTSSTIQAVIGVSSILQNVLISYPTMQLEFYDNFDDGKMHGWHYHNQFSLSGKRFSPTLSKVSRKGTYSLEMQTPAVNYAQCWARKSQGGFVIPTNAKKAIFGCDWAWHGSYQYGGYGFTFNMDTEDNSGNRKWFKVRWVESLDGVSYAMKWQYDSSGSDTAVWVDIPGAAQTISWNEPYKQTFSRMYFVIDLLNAKIERLWTDNNSYNLTGLTIGNGTSLPNYYNTMNNFLYCENRGTQTAYENSMYVENPFFGFVY